MRKVVLYFLLVTCNMHDMLLHVEHAAELAQRHNVAVVEEREKGNARD